jgi:hypothetical protein
MAFIVKEGTNFRKTDYVSGEFCDQPMAQVDPKLPDPTDRFRGSEIDPFMARYSTAQ